MSNGPVVMRALDAEAESGERSRHLSAIEFLAKTTRVPVDQITKRYEFELAKLKVGASVNDFLPVLAIRKVRGHFGKGN